MAKRICFACREYWYNFDSKEEAQKFIKDNQSKGWLFPSDEPQKDDAMDVWCVEVKKPIQGYYPGW